MAGIVLPSAEKNPPAPVLVINSGSSSLKFGVYRQGARDEEPILTGSAYGIGRPDGLLKIKSADGQTLLERAGAHDSQQTALSAVSSAIQQHLDVPLAAVGHRIVHGGARLLAHQLITPQVLQELKAAEHFAPLHVPQSLSLIAAAQKLFPDAIHVACFDTVFHQTMPEVAARLPLPQRYFNAGIRKYGFHGLSYESLVWHFGKQLPDRAIFAHLGNGASLCALRNGKSIDTSMGLTPAGGIVMGTRTGDLDPGILIYLLRNEHRSADDLETLINHDSGLRALSNGESSVKELEARRDAGDSLAALALQAFILSVRKMVGAYIALLGGVDLLVFTGGIGENSSYVRSAVTTGLVSLGLTPDKVQVVHAAEELQIARHCRRILHS